MVAVGIQPPGYEQGGSYSALVDRLYRNSVMLMPTHAGDTLTGARGGLLPAPDARSAIISAAGWNLTVAPFPIVVENTFASSQGDYIVVSPANLVVSVTPSSPTTNRIDIVGVQVSDAFYAGAVNSGDLVVVQGTPTAGTPTDPTLPASFEPLWRGTVNANSTTPVWTSMRRRTSPVGGLCPVFSDQTLTPGRYIGEARLLPATGSFPPRPVFWDGTNWRGSGGFAFNVATPPLNTNISASTTLTVASLAITYPGYNYRVSAGGSCRVSGFAAGAVALAILAHMVNTTTFPSVQGNDVCSWEPFPNASAGGNAYWNTGTHAAAASYSASATVYQLLRNNDSGVRIYQGADLGNKFSVRLDAV